MTCSWCKRDATDGFRLHDPAQARSATFCRLEHLVAWSIRGGAWEPSAPAAAESPERCAHCDASLADNALLLVRARGTIRIADAFCSQDHLRAWARAGGRYA